MSLNLVVNPTKNVTVKQAVSAETINNVAEIEIITITDDCVSEIKAVVKIGENTKTLVLWADADYIAIGDWTQNQANSRILELL